MEPTLRLAAQLLLLPQTDEEAEGAGPRSRSQGRFPAKTGLEAKTTPAPNSNALSTHPAGSYPWPLTTVCFCPNPTPQTGLPSLPPGEGLREHSLIFLVSQAKQSQEDKAIAGKNHIQERDCGQCAK
jgi:hypothetical protein